MLLSKKTVVLRRGFAAAAAATAPATRVTPTTGVRGFEEKVSKMSDGLTVASVDLEGPISQFVMAFKAGSRYEQPDEQGVVHFLRNIVGTDSAKYSGLKLLWQSGSIGSNVVASASKDLFVIQLSVIRTHDKLGISLLGELAQPAFKRWDIMSRLETLQADIAYQQPEELVLENLHKAAYRNGPLATPLISTTAPVYSKSSSQVLRTYKQLSAYARARLTTGSAALVGINVDHSVLLSYAQEQKPLQLPEGEGGSPSPKPATPSPYFGGDVRVPGNTALAHVALAGQGARLSDMKSVAVQAVLTSAFGKGPNTKMVTVQPRGVVSRHVLGAAHHNPVGLSPINLVHSDAGLAGVYLVARGDQIAPLVRAAVDGFAELAKSGPSSEDLAVAKRAAVLETLVRAESSSALAVDLAAQVLANGKTVSPNEFLSLVEQVTAEDVKKAAQQVVGKLALSAYGDLHQVPYSDVI